MLLRGNSQQYFVLRGFTKILKIMTAQIFIDFSTKNTCTCFTRASVCLSVLNSFYSKAWPEKNRKINSLIGCGNLRKSVVKQNEMTHKLSLGKVSVRTHYVGYHSWDNISFVDVHEIQLHFPIKICGDNVCACWFSYISLSPLPRVFSFRHSQRNGQSEKSWLYN